MKSRRPWKKHAHIHRVETNNGDVKFSTGPEKRMYADDIESEDRTSLYNSFESLTEAEQFLDTWWATWWPNWWSKQTKSVRRA